MNKYDGSFGNNYFRYFDIRLAEAVTLSGQLVIRSLMNKINEYLNQNLKTTDVDYIIASDTDSLVIILEKFVDKFLPGDKQKDTNKVISLMDMFCEKYLQPIIDGTCSDIGEYLNVATQAISMKREVLADRAIWVAKKRYTMSVLDKEGVRYSEPEIKIMGIEAVRTSTPTVCREKIKGALKIILHGTELELQEFSKKFHEEFKKMGPEDVAFPRTVNGLPKYKCNANIYMKGSPIHVRSALLYNYLLKNKKITKKYETIKEGEKIKFLYLREPNHCNDNVIAFSNVLPIEFEVHNAIDYDMQFQKTFVEPITLILNVVGWKVEAEKNLNAFFD